MWVCSEYISSIYRVCISEKPSLENTRPAEVDRVYIEYISSIYRGYILHVTRCPVGGINTINILDIYLIYTRFILDKYVFR